MQCGLLGGKLGHSYSPQIHAQFGTYAYTLFEKQPQELAEFLRSGAFSGLNVTIPYKKAVISFCSELSERARQLGAVNTLVRGQDGRLFGYNTDYFGFASTLSQSGFSPTGKKCVVLGSGGASATVSSVLRDAGANVVIISRSGEDNYHNLSRHSDAALIVNATPVGMYPNVGVSPVDLDVFENLELVLDLIYNPARTKLLLDAQSRGISGMNGLWMLVAQAKQSAELFMGERIDNGVISRVYRTMKAHMENVVLIGMPGCGKSTVAQHLGAMIDREVIDTDEQVKQYAQSSVEQIFANEGEAGFRKIETQVLAQLGKLSGKIIATGGGCVTREENYPLLHQNGTIFYIRRDLQLLSVDGRPLSMQTPPAQLYAARKAMYERFADVTIDNDATPDDAARKICSVLEESQ